MLTAAGFTVIGIACDGADAIAQAQRLSPQIVLLDIQLPDVDGFCVAATLRARPDPPAVVLTSSRDGESFGSRLSTAAASGFKTKRALTGATLAALVG